MKKIFLITAGFIFLSLLSSCLYTLHPIFTEKDLVFDNRLLGSWQKDKDGSLAIYEKISSGELGDFSEKLKQNADKIYMVTLKEADGNIKEKYLGFLVKLDGNYYMDFYPSESGPTKNMDDFFKLHFVKLHSVYKIQFGNDHSFELKQFDDSFMKNLVDNKQIRIKHEVMDDGSYLITASTEELQQYIIKYNDVSDAYDKDGISTYTKIK